MGIGAGIASLFFQAGTTAYAVTAAVVNIAVAVGTSLISQALVDTPSAQAPQKDTGRKGNIRSTTEPHNIVYGQVRKGGMIAYLNGTGTDNEFLHRVVIYAAHEIQSFEQFHFDGEELTLDGSGIPAEYPSNARILTMLGAPAQAAQADLVSENDNWTADHKLSGRAYSYDRLKYDPEVFPSFIPAITATIRGTKDVYDPRIDEETYSRNPALVVAHILENYLGVPREKIDEATLIASANYCSATVAELSGATVERFACDGWFLLEGAPEEWLRGPLLAMAGTLVEHAGIYYIHAGGWSASVATITDDDIVGGINFSTARSDTDRSNVITGTFVGPASYDQPSDFPPYKSAAAIAEDGGIERTMNVDLEWVSNPAQAQRVAKILLMENRLDEVISVEVTYEIGRTLRPFQTVTFESDAMGISGTFRITNHSINITDQGLTVSLTMKEHAESVYAWDSETDETEYVSVKGTYWRSDLVTIEDYTLTSNASSGSHTPGSVSLDWAWPHDRTLDEIEVEAILGYEFRETTGDPWEARELEVSGTTVATDPFVLSITDAGDVGGLFQSHVLLQLRVRAIFPGGETGPWNTINDASASSPPEFSGKWYYGYGTYVRIRANPAPAGTVVRREFGASSVVDASSPAIADPEGTAQGYLANGATVKARTYEPGKVPSPTRVWIVNNTGGAYE